MRGKMFSLLTATRLFICCFIAFIAVFCVVFWEEHRHEWVLYTLMLAASACAVWFFRYIGEIDKPEVRARYLWNVRRLHYALFLSLFMGFLFLVFVIASIIQHSGLSFEEELASLGTHTLVGAILLLTLTICSVVLAWRMSDLHMRVLEHHDCVSDQHKAATGHLRIADGVWMVPSNSSPYSAEEITCMSTSVLE